MLNGLPLPPIIIGTWQLAGGHGPVDPAGARTLLRTFVDAGMTAFDCADIYTGVEELLGEFLLILEPSLRSRVRVHTKYVPDLAALGLLSAPDVDRAIARSRARIGVDALDLV
ncbi:MAG: aldo/keto reductase, partial [Gemmatimonadota bacterium]